MASILEQPWPVAWPKGRRRSEFRRVTRCFGVRLPLPRRQPNPLVPMTTRIRAHAMERSALVLTGWAALHVLGMPVFCESMPVEVVSRTNKRALSMRAVQHVKYRGHVPLADRADYSALHFDLPRHVRVVCAEEALVRCLISVLKGRNAWTLPGQDREPRNRRYNGVTFSGRFNSGGLHTAYGLSAYEIRAVQLIDSVRRFVGVDFTAVAERARGRVCRRKLMRLWALSVPNSDSPPETLLRLLVRDLLPDLCTQVPVYRSDSLGEWNAGAMSFSNVGAGRARTSYHESVRGVTRVREYGGSGWARRAPGDGNWQKSCDVRGEGAENGSRDRRRTGQRLLTKIDVASRELWLAMFYDGAHHNDPAQREHDALVDRVLQARGATVLRFTASSMHDPLMVRRQVRQVIARFND